MEEIFQSQDEMEFIPHATDFNDLTSQVKPPLERLSATGGYIFVGISPDGSIQGLNSPDFNNDFCKSCWNPLMNSWKIPPNTIFTSFEIIKENRILEIRIKSFVSIGSAPTETSDPSETFDKMKYEKLILEYLTKQQKEKTPQEIKLFLRQQKMKFQVKDLNKLLHSMHSAKKLKGRKEGQQQYWSVPT